MFRILSCTALVVTLLVAFGCDQSVQSEIPPGTPGCELTCEQAWPCGGVLENDLQTCIDTCEDRAHQAYRACIFRATCDTMPDCKVYAP